MSGYVSKQHLRLDLKGNQITITHLGRNHTLLADFQGVPHQLVQPLTIPLADLVGQSQIFTLADTDVELAFSRV